MDKCIYENVLECEVVSTRAYGRLDEQDVMVNVTPGERRASWRTWGSCSACGSYVRLR